MKKSPVEVGIAYENRVVAVLQSCGLTAYRTNKANESDPKQYKAGFDGRVDIIAKYNVTVRKIYKDFVFYIQERYCVIKEARGTLMWQSWCFALC